MKHFEPSIAALRLVMKIVQTGKLTTAADELNVSQSGASHALSSLESQLGAPLFLREHEGLRLSEFGQRLNGLIEAALASLDRIRAEAGSVTHLEAGSLRVAGVPSLLSTILPPILREYTVRYPGMELSVFEGTDEEVTTWVKSGVAHVGFAALPIDGVLAEEVTRDEWLALVPSAEFRGKASLTLAELLRHRFLMSGGGCERHIQQIFASAGITVRESMMIKQMPTIHAMVAKGLGVSVIPRLSFAGGRSCRVLPLKPRVFRRIGMIRSTGSLPSPAVEAFLSVTRVSLRRPRLPKSVSSREGQRKLLRCVG